MNSRSTLVLSTHRPESIEPAKELMLHHDAIILEEPADERFESMLSGELSIDSYLEGLDLEYPEFSHRMSEMLRKLKGMGKKIYQLEPFLEKLIEIHEMFADGGGPSDLQEGTDLYRVYSEERKAFAALLDFYRASYGGNFDETLDTVKKFAKADARRFLLRDHMRAVAIVEVLKREGSYYVEAGQIHYPLWQALKHRLPAHYPLRVKFLMADAVQAMGLKGHLYGPGDLLTLLYIFHPNRNSREDDHLAAQALIYNKMIQKEEIKETTEPYPHTRDELRVSDTWGKEGRPSLTQ